MAASVWNLATRHGLLDLSFTPSGFPGGYVALAPGATLMPAAGTSISVLVASLEDVCTHRGEPQTGLRTARTSPRLTSPAHVRRSPALETARHVERSECALLARSRAPAGCVRETPGA